MAKAVDKAYQTVRDRIVRGVYPAASRITEQEVAAVAGVSRTPVREALRRLEADGQQVEDRALILEVDPLQLGGEYALETQRSAPASEVPVAGGVLLDRVGPVETVEDCSEALVPRQVGHVGDLHHRILQVSGDHGQVFRVQGHALRTDKLAWLVAVLWIIVLSCAIKPVVQGEFGRYTIATGHTALEGFNRVPGPRAGVSWLVWAWGLTVTLTLLQVGGMYGGVAQVLHLLVPAVSVNAWVGKSTRLNSSHRL